MDGVDDLGAVDALEVDRRDAEVGMAELALDDDQRDTLARHLDGVGVAELVRRESSPDAGERHRVAQLFACGGRRPAAAGVDVSLGERERLVDAKPGAPESARASASRAAWCRPGA